jgi:hypothetical protein
MWHLSPVRNHATSGWDHMSLGYASRSETHHQGNITWTSGGRHGPVCAMSQGRKATVSRDGGEPVSPQGIPNLMG